MLSLASRGVHLSPFIVYWYSVGSRRGIRVLKAEGGRGHGLASHRGLFLFWKHYTTHCLLLVWLCFSLFFFPLRMCVCAHGCDSFGTFIRPWFTLQAELSVVFANQRGISAVNSIIPWKYMLTAKLVQTRYQWFSMRISLKTVLIFEHQSTQHSSRYFTLIGWLLHLNKKENK